MNLPYHLILGSKSPRRKELLEALGLSFDIETYPVEETYDESLNVSEVAEFLARKKALAFRSLKPKELLITADTVVINKKHVLGKPNNREEAIAMLAGLNNSSHLVVSGVCLKSLSKEISFSVSTLVHFNKLTNTEIAAYVDNQKPYDKAGAYGIQEWIGMIGIKAIEGDYYNVVGLPLSRLYQTLKSSFGQ